VAVVVVLVIVVVGFGYVGARLHGIHKVAVVGLHPAGPGSAQTILIAGSDSRAGETAAEAAEFGSAAEVAGARSDLIVLVHVIPSTGQAAMLSIPRDMFLPIAGTSSSNRINVAINSNPSQLVETVEQDFGITVNHFVEETFSGLEAVTDAVGGVCMSFPYPARDGSPTGQGNESGLDIPTAGRHVLDGTEALALVRSRYYQYYAGGSWQAEGTGDIGRIQRQHTFVRALAAKALHDSLHDPLTANAVLTKAVGNVTIDRSYTTMGLMRAALDLRGLHPDGIPSWTMPSTAANDYEGFGDVLMPEPAQDAAVIAAWEAYGAHRVTSTTVSPASVSVSVLNGSGVTGQAAATRDALATLGFEVGSIGTAAKLGGSSTVVAYAPGRSADAKAVAARLGGPMIVREQKGLTTDVQVTTGTGFTGVASVPPATAPPPSPVPPWDPTPC
jgi:LCP family protein required for cell wall assembly